VDIESDQAFSQFVGPFVIAIAVVMGLILVSVLF
jgi:hypothetical protein